MVELLLESHPGGVREQTTDGRLPLHVAVTKSAPIVVSRLLHAWPQAAMVPDVHGCLPLHYAANCRKMDLPFRQPIKATGEMPEVVRMLLAAGPRAAAHPNDAGQLPLHSALFGQPSEMRDRDDPDVNASVLLLLRAYPAAVRLADHAGDYPLHLAARAYEPSSTLIERVAASWPAAALRRNQKSERPIDIALEEQAKNVGNVDQEHRRRDCLRAIEVVLRIAEREEAAEHAAAALMLEEEEAKRSAAAPIGISRKSKKKAKKREAAASHAARSVQAVGQMTASTDTNEGPVHATHSSSRAVARSLSEAASNELVSAERETRSDTIVNTEANPIINDAGVASADDVVNHTTELWNFLLSINGDGSESAEAMAQGDTVRPASDATTEELAGRVGGVGGVCIVCQDAEITHAFMHCGHMCVCSACGEAVLAASSSASCPICREPAAQVMRVYLSGAE